MVLSHLPTLDLFKFSQHLLAPGRSLPTILLLLLVPRTWLQFSIILILARQLSRSILHLDSLDLCFQEV